MTEREQPQPGPEHDEAHPREIQDHIRYTTGPSMYSRAFFERQSRMVPLARPAGDPRRWRIAGRVLLVAAAAAFGARLLLGDDARLWSGIGWLLLACGLVAMARGWYLSDE